MPKKRKSGGKTGSRKGNYGKVQCTKCGRLEDYNRNPSTTYICSLCVQAMLGKKENNIDHLKSKPKRKRIKKWK